MRAAIRLTLRLPPPIHDRLHEVARLTPYSLNDLVLEAIDRYLSTEIAAHPELEARFDEELL